MADAYVYLLPLQGEDWLKLGLSDDPLRRAREFSHRFYDAFDFDQAMLVQFDSRREAAATELTLRRAFAAHNAPMPLSLRAEAGGHTEWFRGAHAGLAAAVQTLEAAGHLVHRPARRWFARALAARRLELHAWSSALLREHLFDPEEILPVPLPAALASQLADALDAYRRFDIGLDDLLPVALADWVRESRPDLHPPFPAGEPT